MESPTRKARQKREQGKEALLSKLASEVSRKMRLMSACENKEDRDIIADEIFSDLTGELDAAAQRKLDAAPGTCFYQVLAHHYQGNPADATTLLVLCRSLWANKVITAVYGLVLHRWILDSSSPLASEERHRHLHILVRAAQGLFQGDMSGGVQRFRPLLQFLYEDVVLAPLTLHALPDDSQDALLVLCITHLPYYLRDPADFPSVLRTFARAAGDRAPAYTSASADPASPSARPLSPAPTPTTSPLLRIASHPVLPRIASHQSIASAASSDVVSAGSVEAVDFAILELCRYLREVKSEVALYRYLECFEALGGTSIFLQLSDLTRLRLQSEIFDLTVPGGPRYTPYKVRRRAGRALDRLYPSGRFVRKIVRFWFRIVHPGDMVASASRALRRALALSLRLGWRALDALAALPALPARLLRSARIRLPERRIREKVRARSPSPGPSPGQVHGMRWRGDRKSLGADGAAAAMSRARGDDDTSPAGPSGAAGTSFSTATSPSVPSRGWLSPWRYVPSGALGGWAAWAVTRTPLLSRWTTGAGRGLNQHVHVHDRTSPDPPMSLTPSPKPRPILVGLGVSAVSAAGLGTMHAARV